MSDYSSRVTHYVEAKNEAELSSMLKKLGLQLQQKLEVINIYHNSNKGRVVAWYFHDTKTQVPLPKNEKVTKKKAKKKVVKKV
jgi:hypothetical protein